MKKFFIYFLLVLISGCMAPKMIMYNSQSDIPLESKSTSTNMKFIKSDDTDLRLAVLSAEDKKSNKEQESYYVIFAPAVVGAGGIVRGIDDINLNYTSSISPSKLTELLEGLKSVINDWPKTYNDDKSFFYNFSVVPEQKIKQLSSNVVEWNPSFRLAYYNYLSKKLVTILIGPEEFKYFYNIKKLSTLNNFYDVLLRAQRELYNMGFKEN